MKKIKFITIDVEGDISSKICRQHFTQDTLYRDPNTIMWLCSFYNGRSHKSYSVRLPRYPRKFRSKITGNIENTLFGWHFRDNIFQYGVKDCGNSEFKSDYVNFLKEIAKILNYCFKNKIVVFFKGFQMCGKRDEYDKEIITTLMSKFNIPCRKECMIDINKVIPNFYMPATHMQKGQRTDNQTYMNNAIKHNLEDSNILWHSIRNHPLALK